MGWASPSPDGSQLAFSARPPSGETSIYVMPSVGGRPREVARLAEDLSSNPGNGPIVWDGTGHLMFVTRALKTGATSVSRVPLSGGPVQKLDVTVTDVRGLRLHPDGRRLAFQGGENSLEIWVMEPPRAGY
jgi:Tol biopolymer transport system component